MRPLRAETPGTIVTFCTDDADVTMAVAAISLGPAGLRIEGRIAGEAHHRATQRGWFGLDPALRTDPPHRDADGTIWIELRLGEMPSEPVGTTEAELVGWLDQLADAPSDDPRRQHGVWMASRIGAATPAGPPQCTLWHYLTGDTGASTSPADAVAAMVAYLRDGTDDPASTAGLDAAAALLLRWFGDDRFGGVGGDTERALRLAATDLDEVGRRHGVTDHLLTAWDVLTDDAVDPVAVDGGRAIVFTVDGTGASWHAVVEQRDIDTLVVSSLSPVDLPLDRFVDGMELVLRCNRDLARSSFDLDVETGELALRTGVDLSDAADDGAAIRRAIHTNARSLDELLPALRAFAAGASVAESLAVLDATDDEPDADT